ncbi:MAG: dioxygenase family protein [Nitrospiraceae bacterium]
MRWNHLVLFAMLGPGMLTSEPLTTAQPVCVPTPPQTEGPYYPPRAVIDKLLHEDNDLTQITGNEGNARGQVIYIMGHVRDQRCDPVSGVRIEIWQASANGRYNHPSDRSAVAPLDPNFQYWGQTHTDQEGWYLFKTIKPGPYEAGFGWIRPSHIHLKVHAPDRRELTTQIYFAGDSHQESDRILNRVPPDERDRVIVKLDEPGKEFEAGSKVSMFDIVL